MLSVLDPSKVNIISLVAMVVIQGSTSKEPLRDHNHYICNYDGDDSDIYVSNKTQ